MAALRVIQWTTGNIGSRSLHALITRPEFELVGVYAYGADKVGRDAASLCGLDVPTRILATNDVDVLLALKPDACVYNPLWSDTDELCRLLGSGINVCSTAGWITGGKLAAEERARVQQAAERGGATMFGSGAHPGFTNLISLVGTQMCERVDAVTVTESVDCSTYASAGTMRAMGFAQPADTPGLQESVRCESEVFAEAAAMTADALGLTIDRFTFDALFAVATADSDLGFMMVPRDTVAAVQGYHRGWVGDRNVVSVGFQWTMGNHVDPPFKLAHGHVIQIDGRPGARIVVQLRPGHDWDEDGYMGLGMIYTAMPAVNAVAAVVAARPGILTLADLPLVTGRASQAR
ncbi:MAG: dihydrodipicolinate reductase [Actinomycetota bacterium]|nr:dihydrodipicolinate reductase [Actinomycetota bacterium]